MTKQGCKKNLGGRPTSYSPELVHAIISQSMRGGMPLAKIDTAFVKQQMCEHHGVSDQIRLESLKNLVEPILEEFAEEERQGLLRDLPEGVDLAVDEAVVSAGRELLLIVARQNAACKAAADRGCEEIRADKRNAVLRLMEVEAALKAQQDENRKLAKERDQATAKLAAAQVHLSAAQAEVERLGRDSGTVDRLPTELRNPAVREDIRAALKEIVTAPEAEPPAP